MRLVMIAASLVLFGTEVASANQDLRSGYAITNPAPKVVTNVCADLEPTFAELRHALDLATTQAVAAQTEAKGLGMWSGPKHFAHLADDASSIMHLAEPSLDEVTDIPIALDEAPSGDPKTAALALANAYEKSFEDLRTFARAALVYDQAAQNGQSAKLDSIFPFGMPTTANKIDATNAAIVEDQMKASFDGSRGSRDVARTLKLPLYHWENACRPTTDANSTANTAPYPSPSP